MYIEIKNTNTSKVKIPAIDEPVEFNKNGIARVQEDVGKKLIEELDSVKERSNDEDEEEDEDSESFSVERQEESEDEESSDEE